MVGGSIGLYEPITLRSYENMRTHTYIYIYIHR